MNNYYSIFDEYMKYKNFKKFNSNFKDEIN
jgi:hypothetical protein